MLHKPCQIEFKIGYRVTRKPVNNFSRDGMIGTIVEELENRSKIKWDKKASTGQQHSTIQNRFLTIKF